MQAISRFQCFRPINTFLVCLVSLVFCAGKGITFAGTVDESQSAWHTKYKKQENAPDPKEMLLNTDPEPDVHEGFTPLFNGKDLKGFSQKNGTATFEAKAGSIVGITAKGSPNSFLCTDKLYGDFELTFEVKVHNSLNSGVMIRSQTKGNTPEGRVNGPQVEIEASGAKGAESGYIYGEACGGWMTPKNLLKPHKHFKDGEK